jgi:DNA-binding MarR family transcriptional regulator
MASITQKPQRKFQAVHGGPNGSADAGREAWMLLIQLLRAERGKFMSAGADLDLTPTQAQLLLRLEPEHPVPMNELANMLFCDASNITGLVDKLESRRLIERRTDAKDRRVKMIGVTQAGAGLRGKLKERLSQPPPSIASLPEKDKKALGIILRKALELQR